MLILRTIMSLLEREGTCLLSRRVVELVKHDVNCCNPSWIQALLLLRKNRFCHHAPQCLILCKISILYGKGPWRSIRQILSCCSWFEHTWIKLAMFAWWLFWLSNLREYVRKGTFLLHTVRSWITSHCWFAGLWVLNWILLTSFVNYRVGKRSCGWVVVYHAAWD